MGMSALQPVLHRTSLNSRAPVVQERVGVGAVDMACQPAATAANKQFQIVNLPYLVKDYAQAKRNYSPGAPLRNAVAELYAKEGIRGLAAWPVHFNGISLNKEPRDPGNPDVSERTKIRVPPMKSFQLLADNTGYIGAPIPFSEAFTAVQTGVVDGVIGSGAEGYYASFRDVTKYYIPSNTHFEVWYLIINDELFKGLDEKVRKQVEEAALQFEQRRWETVEADQAANEKKLADYGAKIVRLTPEQIARLAQKAHATVWPAIENDVGKDWAQKILSQIVQ